MLKAEASSNTAEIEKVLEPKTGEAEEEGEKEVKGQDFVMTVNIRLRHSF